MHYPTDRIAHTTAFVTPVVEHWPEREIAQRVHPMKDRSDDPSHHEYKDGVHITALYNTNLRNTVTKYELLTEIIPGRSTNTIL